MKNQLHKLRVLTIVFALAGFFFSAQAFAGSLSGKVTKSGDGSPVVGALVSAQSTSFSYSTVTDGNGDYYMWVTPGTYTMKFSKDLFCTTTINGVAQDQVENVSLVFNHFGFIGGSYYNSFWWDQYIFGAVFAAGPDLQAGDEIGVFDGPKCVGLLILDGPVNAYYQPKLTAFATLSDGSAGYVSGDASVYKCYTTAGVQALGTAVRSNPWGGSPYMLNTFPAGNPYSVDNLTFTSPVVVDVDVHVTAFTGGGNLSGVSVTIGGVTKTTGAGGLLTSHFSLYQGIYPVTATLAGYNTFNGTVTVPAVGPYVYALAMHTSSTTISGLITAADGITAISGATVSAVPTLGGGVVAPVVSGVDGSYTLDCPTGGTYTISAAKATFTTGTKTGVVVATGSNISGQNVVLTIGSPFPAVTGDPNNTWTIYLQNVQFGAFVMVSGDELAIYDAPSNTIVGKFVLNGGLAVNPYQNEMVVYLSGTTGFNPGPGHQFYFKAWRANTNELMALVTTETFSATTSYNPPVTPVFPTITDNNEYSLLNLAFGYAAPTSTQNITLQVGPNWISSYVTNTALSGSTVTGTAAMDIDNIVYLADAGVGMLNTAYTVIKNTAGASYHGHAPGGGEGPGLLTLNNQEGYSFDMLTGPHTLVFQGPLCSPTTPIIVDNSAGVLPVRPFIPYLQTYAMTASYALNTILTAPPVGYNAVDWVKDDMGHMIRFLGGVWVNNIGSLNPGKGYQVQIAAGNKMSLAYSGFKSGESATNEDNKPTHFQIYGDAANWVYTIYLDVNQFSAGDEIAAFDGDRLVGATKLVDGTGLYKNAIPVFHQLTDKIGYQPGDPITLKGYDHTLNQEVNCVYTMQTIASANPWMESVYPTGEGKYSLASITKYANGVNEASNVLLNVYPNPARDYIKVVANQNIDKVVLLNVLGAIVREKNVSSQETQLNVGGLNSGIYILQITVNGQVSTRKVFVN